MTDAASANPYESPRRAESAPPSLASTAESKARARFRWGVVALGFAAWSNYGCLFLSGRPPGVIATLFVVLAVYNFVWLMALCAALWFAGFPLLKLVAGWLHALFGGRTTRQAWLDCFYRASWPLSYAARLGALLWLVWLALFFYAGHPGGRALDAVFIVLGNVLGAWVYGNILLQWVQLRGQAAHEVPVEVIDSDEARDEF
jgi:hypothetical protein